MSAPKSIQRFETYIQLAIVVTLIYACFRVFAPFIGAIVWGTIIAISLWPLYCRIRRRLGGRDGLTATLLGLALASLLVIPLIMLGTSVVDGVNWLMDQNINVDTVRNYELPAWLLGLPVVGAKIAQAWQNMLQHLSETLQQITPFLKDAMLWLVKKSTGAGMAAVQFLIAILVAMILLAKQQSGTDFAIRLAQRISPVRGKYLADTAQKTIRGVSAGVMGTAFVQAALTTIGLVVAGVPAAAALGFATFLIAVVQLPTLFVWAPAAFWLYHSGDSFAASGLALWGLLVVNTIDNFLKPYLISQGANLPLSLIFIGVIGGLLAWGFVGLFIGPTILAIAYTLLQDWLYQQENEDPAEIPNKDQA